MVLLGARFPSKRPPGFWGVVDPEVEHGNSDRYFSTPPTRIRVTLTKTPRVRTGPDPKAAWPRRRRKADVENPDYAAFATRVIRAHARRIAEGDTEGLADLLALAHELDTATQTAATGLRAFGFGYSWGDIATRLGTTRQAAQQRWGH